MLRCSIRALHNICDLPEVGGCNSAFVTNQVNPLDDEVVDSNSFLSGPSNRTQFLEALDNLVTTAGAGHNSSCELFNPSDDWLKERMPIFQDMSHDQQQEILAEVESLRELAADANSSG